MSNLASFFCTASSTSWFVMAMLLPPSKLTIISRALSIFLPSPPLILTRASHSFIVIFLVLNIGSRLHAWVTRSFRSCSSRGFSTNTSQRESRAAFTSKLGFSVVAPISVIIPCSTAPSRASCWLLLNRCISSMKSIALPPLPINLVFLAFSMVSRMSFTPALIALS